MTNIIGKITPVTNIIGRIDGKASATVISAHNTAEDSHADIRSDLSDVSTQLAEKANKTQEAWITPTLLNGWVGDLRYRKTEYNRLEFVGSVSGGTGSILTLIPTHRPLTNQFIPIIYASSSLARLSVLSSGIVTPQTAVNSSVITFSHITISLD